MASEPLRRRLYQQLEGDRLDDGFSALNKILIVVILVSVGVAILDTEPAVHAFAPRSFALAETFFGFVFLAEYVARLWSITERLGPDGDAAKRFRFVFSLSGLVDLVVVVATLSPIFTQNLVMLRLLRALRIIRLAKLGRMSMAMRTLSNAVHERRYELVLTIMLALGLLIFGATALYWIEGDLQPDKFGSIPRSLWWAVITITTIGYGDVYPITVAGKIVASLVAVAGIGLIAMPTGILAAAFSDAMQRKDRDAS